MAQIANQDNLIIEISGALSAMDGTTKAKLVECVKGGTIFDVILKSVEAANNVNYGKVVGVKIDNTTAATPKYTVDIVNSSDGAADAIALN